MKGSDDSLSMLQVSQKQLDLLSIIIDSKILRINFDLC